MCLLSVSTSVCIKQVNINKKKILELFIVTGKTICNKWVFTECGFQCTSVIDETIYM